MVYKIPYKTNISRGFTIVELLLVIGILLILITAAVLVINPSVHLKNGRDNRRINDLALLDRIIIEYHLDTGLYPDDFNTLRLSNVLPVGSTALTKSNRGWINVNLSSYNSKLPIDPLNTGNYVYKYIHNNSTYELSTLLETPTNVSNSDGGNDSASYELGNNLTLISP